MKKLDFSKTIKNICYEKESQTPEFPNHFKINVTKSYRYAYSEFYTSTLWLGWEQVTIVHRSKAFWSKRNNNAQQKSMCYTKRALASAGLDQSRWLTTTDDRHRRSVPPRSATAEHHRSRTATQGRTAGGYPSKFSTKHITCDFFCYCCLIVHCDAQKMITFCYCMRSAYYDFPQATRAKTCINFSQGCTYYVSLLTNLSMFMHCWQVQ